MGQITQSIGISGLMGGIQGFIASGFNPVGFVVGLAVGAAVGGLAAISNQPKNPGPRRTLDEIFSTSTRNAPVPVVFGRARLAGNHISIGQFWIITSNLPNTPGRYLYIANCIMGLCEGPIQEAGDFFVDRDCRENLAKREQQPLRNYAVQIQNGYPTDTVSGYVTRTDAGYGETPMVPFRNTAKAVLFTIVGETPRLPDLNVDVVGPDYTINLVKGTTDPNPSDAVTCTSYDAYTQSWYSVVTASEMDGESFPFGMVQQGRGNHPRRYYTPPPAGITDNVLHGWYLGRHDVLVMQDPSDSAGFWIGCWGIASDSDLWEHFKPDESYNNPILLHHLDELHGILHTLHDDGSLRYIMQWNLLSGRITRVDVPQLTVNGEWRKMLYSADLDSYIIANGNSPSGTIGTRTHPRDTNIDDFGDQGAIWFIHPRTGEVTNAFNGLGTGACNGLCVSGNLVGVITTDSGLYYYDQNESRTLGPYGTDSHGYDPGSLASSWVTQNTWTNHVTLVKNNSGAAVYVNFLPSVIEDPEDLSADGTPESKNHPEGEFQTFPDPDPVAGWIRDWSYRTYNSILMRLLQGNSSLAAAMWHTLFGSGNINKAIDAAKADDNLYFVGQNADHLNFAYDSARWGAGLDASFGNFSSFEAVHGYCVGGVLQLAVRIVKGKSREYYGERAKLDFVLDSFRTCSDVIANEMLASINGYRKIENGQLVVGWERKGQFPLWHFGDDQTADGKGSVLFTGRLDGINRVRVQWTHVRDDFRKDIVQADDEYNQNAVGRVHEQMVNVSGIGRINHAKWLASLVLDTLTAARRQVSFNTHFLGYVLTPGDTIEVTQSGMGIFRMPAIVHELKESGEKALTVTALEHPLLQPAMHRAQRQGIPTPPGKGGGSNPPGGGGLCSLMKGAFIGDPDGAVFWLKNGAEFPVATYTLTYEGGSFANSDGTESVKGYEIVTLVSGTVTALADAPGLAGSWANADIAATANFGQHSSIALTSPGPLGLRIKASVTPFVTAGTSPVTIQACPPMIPTPIPTPPPDDGGGEDIGGEHCDPAILATLPTTYSIRFNCNVLTSSGGSPQPADTAYINSQPWPVTFGFGEWSGPMAGGPNPGGAAGVGLRCFPGGWGVNFSYDDLQVNATFVRLTASNNPVGFYTGSNGSCTVS